MHRRRSVIEADPNLSPARTQGLDTQPGEKEATDGS
jgi:hypothetical protein